MAAQRGAARRGRRGRRARRHLRQPRLHPEEALQLRRPLRRELRGSARLRLVACGAPSFDWERAEGEPGAARSAASTASTAQLMTSAGVTLLRGRARVVGAGRGRGRRRAPSRRAHPRRHRRLAGPARRARRRARDQLERDLRPAALPEAPGRRRRRLHRLRVRLDLQRPRRRGDAALSRRADPARLRRDVRDFVAAEMGKKGVDIRVGAQVRALERRPAARSASCSATAASSRPTPCSTRPAARPTPPGSASRRSASRSTLNGAVVVDDALSQQRAEHLRDRRRHRPGPAHAGRARRGDGAGRRPLRRGRPPGRLHAHPDRGLHPSEHRHDRPLRGRRRAAASSGSASTAPSSSRCATRCRAAASAR